MPEYSRSLSQLSAEVSAVVPESVDPATALIAGIPPKPLRLAITSTIVEAHSAELGASDVRAVLAEEMLERVTRDPYSRSARKEAREFLEATLADQQAAIEKYQELAPTLQLAHDVDARQTKLARPARVLAVLGLAAVFGGGAAYGLSHAAEQSNRDAIKMTVQDNKQYPDQKRPLPKAALSGGQEGALAAVAIGAGSVGAVYGSFLMGGIGDRSARKRAQKIVRKAS